MLPSFGTVSLPNRITARPVSVGPRYGALASPRTIWSTPAQPAHVVEPPAFHLLLPLATALRPTSSASFARTATLLPDAPTAWRAAGRLIEYGRSSVVASGFLDSAA